MKATGPNGRLARPKGRIRSKVGGGLGFLAALLLAATAMAAGDLAQLPDAVAKIKPSVVGVGTIQKRRRPPNLILGTGFAVADGRHVVTNAHVVPEKLDAKKKETLAVFVGQGPATRIYPARLVTADETHDLAILRFEGPALPPAVLDDRRRLREGELLAFTGFPLGAVLGPYPSTARGILAAVTPIIRPLMHGRGMEGDFVRYLEDPFEVYQLDAVAFPGHSGSPLYDVASVRVVGVINMVFVKGKKENALTDPSGISYAIPITHTLNLMASAGLRP